MGAPAKLLGLALIAIATVVFVFYTSWTILLPLGYLDGIEVLQPYLSYFPPKQFASIGPAVILSIALLLVGMFILATTMKQKSAKKKA